MNKFKIALLTVVFVGLFACTTTQQPKKTVKTRFLKNNISQTELNNPKDYKRFKFVFNHLLPAFKRKPHER